MPGIVARHGQREIEAGAEFERVERTRRPGLRPPA